MVVFCVLVLLLIAVTISTRDGLESLALDAQENVVGVIELTGLIDSSKEFLEDLYELISNDKIKGVLLRVDSPGGAVGPSQEIYEAVRTLKAKKPIVASMGSLAASGGLYAVLGASKILCQPGTITGSIGVILQLPNFSRVSEKLGVDMVTIKSGRLKDVGNVFRQMTEEERAFLEGTISSAHEDFIRAVMEGRGLSRADVLKFSDGRIILGSEAKKLKLVDDFGGVYEAGRVVFELLGTPLKEGEYPTLYYTRDEFAKLKRFFSGVLELPESWASRMELKYVMF